MIARIRTAWKQVRQPRNSAGDNPPRRSDQARLRMERRARRQQTYQTVNGLFRVSPAEFWASARTGAKWLLLGSAAGVLAGTASAVFLIALSWATAFRLAHPELLFLLPLAGFALGWIYFRYAGSAARGNNLVIEQVHANHTPIPLRMAPLVLVGTVITHLFGGSAGREGTAIQMGASLADGLQRRLGLSREDRRLMLMAGISGGFGSVFGTPVAGFVFGLEVQSVGRIRYEGIIPCLTAALVGDLVTRAWGVTHASYPRLAEVGIDGGLLLKVALAGIAFGLASFLFIELTHGIKHLVAHALRWPPLRPLAGGLVIVGLTLLLGTQDYLGLSLPLIQHALDASVGVVALAFLLKLIFTAITLGSGFLGGEVTPLFVIGSTMGYTVGRLLGVDPVWMASLGFVAVFAGAANTPLACALMGIELFGGGSALYLVVGCVVAYLASGLRSIYVTQRIDIAKAAGIAALPDESIETLAARRAGWLPPPPALALRPVRAIMSPDPVAVPATATIAELVDLAVREGVRSLPVLDQNGSVVGLISDNDLLRHGVLPLRLGLLAALTADERAALLQNAGQRTVSKVMSAPALTLPLAATFADALALLAVRDLKRVPLVDAGGRLRGMLTRSDLLRELVFSEAAVWSAGVPLNWQIPVENVMSAAVTTVLATAPLSAVLQAMLDSGQKRLIVVDEAEKPLGLITDGDLLARVRRDSRPVLLEAFAALWTGKPFTDALASLDGQTAAEVMSAPLVAVPLGTTARAALRLLLEYGFKRLPVVDTDGRVVGLVGRAGLLRAVLEQPPA